MAFDFDYVIFVFGGEVGHSAEKPYALVRLKSRLDNLDEIARKVLEKSHVVEWFDDPAHAWEAFLSKAKLVDGPADWSIRTRNIDAV
jgi:hypothetical protein